MLGCSNVYVLGSFYTVLITMVEIFFFEVCPFDLSGVVLKPIRDFLPFE